MIANDTLRKTIGRTLAAGGLTSVLATATVAAVLAATVSTSAAAPTRSGEEAGPGAGEPGQLVDVVCFNTPPKWNVALDGPLPGCSRTVR